MKKNSLLTVAFLAFPHFLAADIKTEDPKFTEPARNYDLQNVRVELKLDVDNKSFEGSVTNTIVPLFDGITSARIDLIGLEIQSISLQGNSLSYQRFEDGPRKGIEINLEKSYGVSDRLPIVIRYAGKNPEKGLYFIGPNENSPEKPYQIWSQGEDMDTRYWIPTYDYPNDRTTSEFFFTVREPLTVVSNGTLIDTKPAGEVDGKKWHTFHWKMDQPYVTYLFAIAAADWEKYTDTMSLPGRAQPLSIDYYVNRGVGEATARRSYEETPRMIEFFSRKIGVPYPWDKYAQATVTDFVVGGMENVSITLNTDQTLHDERAHLDQSSRGLVAHELAHQWWGDYLTCRSWADIWLNEGFATYFQCLYEREVEGEDAFRAAMRRNQQEARNRDSKENPRPIVESFVDSQSKGRGNHVYDKGSSILYMLHRMLGEELWWKAIHHYATKHAMGVVDTHDFEIAIREATGKNFDWFFQQYVYLGAYPEFDVTQEWMPETAQLKLTVKQTQKIEGIRPLFRVPIEIAITTTEGSKNYSVWCDALEQNFYFPVESRPLMLRFDKDSWVLKTVKFDLPAQMLRYQLAQDSDVVGRIEAAEALAEKKEEVDQNRAALAQSLKGDAQHFVRQAAANAIIKLGGEEAKLALVAGLNDKKSSVRKACVEGLSNYPADAAVIEKLKLVLQEDLSYPTQAAALASLVKVDADRASDYLAQGLKTPSFRDQICAKAIELLADQKNSNTFDTIRPYLSPTHSREINRAACNALAKLGKDRSDTERKELVDAIASFTKRELPRQRRIPVEALATLGDKRAIPFLEELTNRDSRMVTDSRRGAQEAALRALEKLRNDGESSKKTNIAETESLKKELERLKSIIESLEKRIPVAVEASANK